MEAWSKIQMIGLGSREVGLLAPHHRGILRPESNRNVLKHWEELMELNCKYKIYEHLDKRWWLGRENVESHWSGIPRC